jgi:hypothetical protein
MFSSSYRDDFALHRLAMAASCTLAELAQAISDLSAKE